MRQKNVSMRSFIDRFVKRLEFSVFLAIPLTPLFAGNGSYRMQI
jgi:hypothetical protein